MQKITDIRSGIYLLEFFTQGSPPLSIKKFSAAALQKGYYYYVGSAQKNFHHRIGRHLRNKKKVHWHIDHLTTNEHFKIKRIFIFPNAPKDFECKLRSNMQTEFKMESPLLGFGNGDCNICATHLLFRKSKIDQNHFISLYQSMVLLIPASKETFWE